LDDSRLFQISMDGPNVNLKFFREFSSQFKENNNHSLVDIGSCCLHVINGSFARGAEKSEWSLKKLLKGAYHLLHNTPARREDYESLTGSFNLALKFLLNQVSGTMKDVIFHKTLNQTLDDHYINRQPLY